MPRESGRRAVVTIALVVCLSSMARGQQPAAATQEGADLARQLSNPIASLVSVPFQFNWEQNVGPSELTRFILNVQPVMPFTVNESVNLIVRLIAPLVSQPPLFENGLATFGMGDVTTSFFVSPSKSTRLIWGAGPLVVLPSTSEPTLGSGKWSAGPTIVALKQTGPWTVGALWNQAWSFSGDPSRGDVNQMFLQPFVSYQATRTITISVNSEMTANWETDDDDDTWTVPINVVVSKLSSFGTFPASYQVGFGAFPVHPEVGPSWKIRAAIVILLPRAQSSRPRRRQLNHRRRRVRTVSAGKETPCKRARRAQRHPQVECVGAARCKGKGRRKMATPRLPATEHGSPLQTRLSSSASMARAEEWLRQMTIEEKAMQLSSVFPLALFNTEGTNRSQLDALLENGIGHVSALGLIGHKTRASGGAPRSCSCTRRTRRAVSLCPQSNS